MNSNFRKPSVHPGIDAKAQDFAKVAKEFTDAALVARQVFPTPYNRIVHSPEQGVTIVEPMKVDPNAEIDSIKRRYCSIFLYIPELLCFRIDNTLRCGIGASTTREK